MTARSANAEGGSSYRYCAVLGCEPQGVHTGTQFSDVKALLETRLRRPGKPREGLAHVRSVQIGDTLGDLASVQPQTHPGSPPIREKGPTRDRLRRPTYEGANRLPVQ